MAPSRATVERWIQGFEAAQRVERTLRRPREAPCVAALALQLSDAALAARAPDMRARRDAEDQRVLETWCRLKQRRP